MFWTRSISHPSPSISAGDALFMPCTVQELLEVYDEDGDDDETPYIPGVDDLLPWGTRTAAGFLVMGQHVLEATIDPHDSVDLTRGRPRFTMNKVPIRAPIIIYLCVMPVVVVHLCIVTVWCCFVMPHRHTGLHMYSLFQPHHRWLVAR
jgi:hypothetical protein